MNHGIEVVQSDHVRKSIDRNQPNTLYANIQMTPGVAAEALQEALGDPELEELSGLKFVVHRVIPFARPVSLLFLKDDAQDWPWHTLFLPWHTSGEYPVPCFPDSPEKLWDPAHARELESSGSMRPRINWGNAYENGRPVKNSGRHVLNVADVTRPMDEFNSHVLTDDAESAFPGVFLVHEETTNVLFPMTDRSVMRWKIHVLPQYRESSVVVEGREIAMKRALARELNKRRTAAVQSARTQRHQ
ncbi:hypothetical protein PG2083B_0515 [Bifidobacterium pseudolongum subsp. globosum]|uniref:hypothetical protein n=1 Tax=Bifidobacterium pseudolongum TaxID=1694 RepID=UPI001022163F|nr:hypothetical protein [Bifidobacterium pseudolongum]RYQ18376.1 hypothetical protein PG2083B_0515 [Bifidobacterium pseudolongum subsp. globosum]